MGYAAVLKEQPQQDIIGIHPCGLERQRKDRRERGGEPIGYWLFKPRLTAWRTVQHENTEKFGKIQIIYITRR